jgi:Domain of unknown function (DUF222)
VPAPTPSPRRLPGAPIKDPCLADGGELANTPLLAEDPWLAEDPGPPPPWPSDQAEPPGPWVPEHAEPGDPEDILGWLDAELAKAAPWLADRGWDDPAPPGPPGGRPEVFKAGRWDRSRGEGGGFAAGGLADHLPPGPVLAGLAGDRWQAGLDRLSDDELIGILRAARRLASWATAMELAAVGDLWRRRTAEEDAGDSGAAAHADAEIAAALTLTRHAADQVLGLAAALGRLPATRAALAAGDIDPPRAKVIAEEVTGLTDDHAAAVDQAVAAAAPGLTTGQLRPAARRAVLAADPTAATKRKEQALRQARVERWSEPAGTAALAGRDLPPAGVLAADANLTALAKQLKTAGADGTLDTLRAQIYLALLTGAPVSSLRPANPGENRPSTTGPPDADGPGDTSGPSGNGPGEDGPPDENPAGTSGLPSGNPTADPPTTTGSPVAAPTGHLPQPGDPRAPRVTGQVNLTLPLTTWLGHTHTPGHAAGYGPLDATDARTLADALAAHPSTQWCLTFTGPDGRPAAHGCTRTRPLPRPRTGSRDGPGTRARPPPWTFTLTPLHSGGCDHAWQTPAYRPTAALRHLVNLRHATCVFPGCRRPATQCDTDHTLAYHHGGTTCLCNLSPLCRHHHQVKQAPGWTLEQTSPATLTWTTPSRRRYTVGPASYPE